MQVKIYSAFCKGEVNVFNGDTATIMSEGTYEVLKNDPKKKVYNFELKLKDGEIKVGSFNNPTITNLMSAWGDDTKVWVGKEIVASVSKIFAFGREAYSIVWKPKTK
jgi:hypothetical protein